MHARHKRNTNTATLSRVDPATVNYAGAFRRDRSCNDGFAAMGAHQQIHSRHSWPNGLHGYLTRLAFNQPCTYKRTTSGAL
jgi:hypothetical protein